MESRFNTFTDDVFIGFFAAVFLGHIIGVILLSLSIKV